MCYPVFVILFKNLIFCDFIGHYVVELDAYLLFTLLQGDPSGCSLGVVDIKTKVAF